MRWQEDSSSSSNGYTRSVTLLETRMFLEGLHTLCNRLMNSRSPPVITWYPDDWLRVISSLVVSSHRLKMNAIMDFLSTISLFHSWDLEEVLLLQTEWCDTCGLVLGMGVISTISDLVGTLPDGTSSPMRGSIIPGFTWCLDGRYLLIKRSNKNSSCVGSMLVLIISEI